MKCPKCQHKNPADTHFCGKCGAPLKSSQEKSETFTKTLRIPLLELGVGSTFAGRYQVIEDLGKGGMGRVYKVVDKEIKENVALKIIKPEIASDERIIERFRNELKMARKISHKNVCAMYHLSKDENGTHYITMEYVPGEDLKSLVKRIGQFSVGKAVFIARQICEGLAEAHRLGVVHRDLKPQNIMIDADGDARIMDFGIASSLKTKGLTDADVMIGTPEYMSPEQVEGREVDKRSDIYSLGVILYEMLTGRVPFQGDTALSIAVKHKTEVPPEPKKFNAHIPDYLNQVILKCMGKKKEKRYQSAEELCADLSRIEKSITASGEIRLPKAAKQKKVEAAKFRVQWIAVPVLGVFVLLSAYALWKRTLRPPRSYENFISLELMTTGSQDVQKNLIEYLLLRSLSASTRLNIFPREDVLVYKKKTESVEQKPKEPLIAIVGNIFPQVTGLEIVMSVRVLDRTANKTFESKGYFDFIADTVEKIRSFIAGQSDGLVGAISENRTTAQTCSANYDALTHFLKGEEAWAKLDSDTAFYEYRTAIENDQDFSLARLKFADVLVFRGDWENAGKNLDLALAKKERLIDNDLLRLQALMARLHFRPSEERQYIGKLTEEFPFRKEYHYEFGESYFRSGEAEEAIKHYEKALELDPNYSLAHNHIAYCYSWIGTHDLAEQHFKRYVELDNTANSYDSFAAGYMFAGRYDDAIKVLRQGLQLSPNLDYLYGSIANNHILKGRLSRALEAIQREAEVTQRDNTKANTFFYRAYIEFLRRNFQKARQELKPARDFYSQGPYAGRLDEAPNLPFWLSGVMAAQQGDLKTLREEIARLDQKITMNGVSATNYFPVYKLYIHLKTLESFAAKNGNAVMKNIEEGRRIKEKMGYWSSTFNLPFFLSAYAAILIRLDRTADALPLLNDVNQYHDKYPSVHILLAKIYLRQGDRKKAEDEYRKALDLLSGADQDYVFSEEARQIGREITF